MAKTSCPQLVGRCLVGFVLALATMASQDIAFAPKAPSVSLAPPEVLTVAPGKAGKLTLHFRVVPGFHINSNAPKSDYLIPTALKLEPSPSVTIAKITYPDGEDMSFPFSPDEKLNVYTGDFAIELAVRPAQKVTPGEYSVHGKLKYQACDNSACYPPKQLAVDFQVKVTKGSSAARKPAVPAGSKP